MSHAMKKLVFMTFALLCLPLASFAASSEIKLDHARYDLTDKASLQRGARTFVNYCLSCHSAGYMRFNRLQDLGLSEDQIEKNLLFSAEKVGETMNIAMNKKDAKEWFGATPPDLSVISRSRGADWLYSYMRGFYKDETRPNGWNNTVFDKVGMPHVLWQLQGIQTLKVEKDPSSHGEKKTLVLEKQGSMTPSEYDAMVSDLVNYLVYMGEPAKTARMQLGIVVILLLGVLFVLSYYLKKEYWRDVH